MFFLQIWLSDWWLVYSVPFCHLGYKITFQTANQLEVPMISSDHQVWLFTDKGGILHTIRPFYHKTEAVYTQKTSFNLFFCFTCLLARFLSAREKQNSIRLSTGHQVHVFIHIFSCQCFAKLFLFLRAFFGALQNPAVGAQQFCMATEDQEILKMYMEDQKSRREIIHQKNPGR